jgi:hypothetical protein
MTCRCLPWLAVALILGVALALMWRPMRDETATTDETAFLGAGYSCWQGHRYYLNVEHPPLMQLWSALPLTFLHIKLPADFVKPEQVPKLRDGYLVIFATRLMATDYQWLREHHKPLTRIANTLFVCALPSSTSRPVAN